MFGASSELASVTEFGFYLFTGINCLSHSARRIPVLLFLTLFLVFRMSVHLCLSIHHSRRPSLTLSLLHYYPPTSQIPPTFGRRFTVSHTVACEFCVRQVIFWRWRRLQVLYVEVSAWTGQIVYFILNLLSFMNNSRTIARTFVYNILRYSVRDCMIKSPYIRRHS